MSFPPVHISYSQTPVSGKSKDILYMDGDFLNLAAVPKFDKGEWIGVRKWYPITNTPYKVLWAQQELLQIPKAEATHFPSPALPVTQFLKLLCWAQMHFFASSLCHHEVLYLGSNFLKRMLTASKMYLCTRISLKRPCDYSINMDRVKKFREMKKKCSLFYVD